MTSTYFEGEARGQPKALRGHSKDKRTDCPLLTLGLVLDASGFVRRSQVFAGNVREHHTLAEMLEALQAPRAALVVMDRGIATEDRLRWLREQGYRYLVVSRERTRHFDAEAALRIETASKHGVHLHKVLCDDAQEVRLYCFSEERAAKERGIAERFAKRFEDALTQLSEGLSKPRTRKRLDKVWQRIGRLKEKSRGIAQHYDIELDTDESGQRATAVRFTCRALPGSMMTHPGVYCLRSSETDWDEATLWRTYFTLTDLDNFRTWNPPRVSGLPLCSENSVDPTCAFPVPARRAMHASSEERMALRVSTSADCCDRVPEVPSLLRAFVFATNRTRSLWGSRSLQTTHRVSIRGRGAPGAPGAVSVGPARRASAGSAPLRA